MNSKIGKSCTKLMFNLFQKRVWQVHYFSRLITVGSHVNYVAMWTGPKLFSGGAAWFFVICQFSSTYIVQTKVLTYQGHETVALL